MAQRTTPKGTVPPKHTRHTKKTRATSKTIHKDSEHNAIAAALTKGTKPIQYGDRYAKNRIGSNG